MFRRQFLKLLSALPLALALRLPIAESKSQPIWQSSGGSPGSDPESMAAYMRRKWELSEPTIYVNSCGSDANDGLTPETPKRTIAAAVEATNDGDTISVWPGTYHEEDKRLNIKGAFLMTGSRIHLGESGTLNLSQASNCFIRDNHFSR